jgi:hypothetical protein
MTMARLDKDAVRGANRLEDVIPGLTGQPLSRNGSRELVTGCPWHDDEHPSLRINVETQQWFCDVCKVGGDVFQYVIRHQQTDFKGALAWCAERAGRVAEPPGRIVATFDYRGLDGRLRYQSCRIEPGPNGRPKTFKQRRPDGHGGWMWNVKGVELVLYRLADLQGKEAVFIVEGERKADRLSDLGLPATCNVGGAGKWKPEYATCLHDGGTRRVAVLGDNDQPGRKHVEDDVAPSCHAAGLVVKLPVLPGLPPKGDIIDWLNAGHMREELLALTRETPNWTPPALSSEAGHTPRVRDGAGLPAAETPMDLATVLDALTAFIRRYVVLTAGQLVMVACWVAHTYAFDAADCTLYLFVNSAEMGSGKTRLLEVLQLLVKAPWFTGRCTAAVLVRKIADQTPTLLLDESDAAFNGPDEYAEALRGLFNSGYRRGGCHSMCVGQGATLTPKDFPIYSPKAFAGLGQLPTTVRDRAATILLKKRTRLESLERFRVRQVRPDAAVLVDALTRWATPAVIARLQTARPALPEALSDRAQECIEPLLAIADLAAGEWPVRLRDATVVVMGGPDDSPSIGVMLLRDIYGVFAEGDCEAIASAELVTALVEHESRPWATIGKGENPLSTHGLASRLKPFGIAPMKIWIEAKAKNGYARRMFEDAWSRHCADLDHLTGTAPEPAQARDLDSRVEGRKDTNKNGPELPMFRVEGESGPSTLKSAIPSMNTGLPSDLPVENPDHEGSHETASVKVERPDGENGHVPELETGDL